MQQNKRTTYLDSTRTIDDRVKDLLAQMTLDEKLAQLGSVWVYELFENLAFSEQKAKRLMVSGIGQITRVGGASSLAPVDSAKMANSIQSFLINNTRLGIPAIVHEECCSGYMAREATCFPQIIGAASTWEPELIEAMAKVISVQMRSVGAHQGLAPVLDITRDARWGRVEEAFGEDPYLTSQLGSAYVRGLQGQDLSEGIIATAKHFVGYGVSEGGMNWATSHIPARELHEVYLTPFEAAIKTANLASIMHAYHDLDGVPCASSRELLTTLLRERWGFEGLVVSDYFAINMLVQHHLTAKDKKEAAQLSLCAGIDMELPSTDCYGEALRQLMQEGGLSESVIDEAVRRILRMKFLVGVFDKPYVDAGKVLEVFDTPAQRTLARQIAQESIVLLKNQDNLLPLKKDLSTIAVIGPNVDSVRNLIGDYAYPCHIESLLEMQEKNTFGTPVPEKVELVDNFVPIISVLEALKGKVSAGTKLLYAKGCDVLEPSQAGFAEAVEIAKQADVVILVVGDKAGLTAGCTTGEARDRAELGLPGVQEALVRAVYETGTPTVAVLINGRPLAIPWIAEHIPAILDAWLPGEEGANAIADVLFGDYNPGGKLPMSFPRGVGQIPIYYGHKPSGGRSHWTGDYVEMSTKPLFPFGYGLSYTCFAYSNLHITPDQVGIDGQVNISVDITNVGGRKGDEVVQLYVHDAMSNVTRPVKELKGFKRITLEPEQRKTVTFHFSVKQLGFYNSEMAYVVEPGITEVMIGSSSSDIRLTGTFGVTGSVTDISNDKVFFSTTDIH